MTRAAARAVVTRVTGALALALAAGPLAAQAPREGHALAGRVVADGGAPLEGARVVLRGPVERTVVSDAGGRWSAALPAGGYDLEVERLGFDAATLRVEVPAAAPLTIRLAPRALALTGLVVTAGRRLQSLADVPVTTELVGRAEIAASGAPDLAAVLTEQTGIQLHGGHPAGAGLMLQGMGSERVLLLVDGQPFIGRMSGNVDLGRLPTAIVERVEVVKGPQATLYGSEAMGGVVNVITRSAGGDGWGASGSWTGGSQGRLDGSLQVDGTVRGTSAWLGVGARTHDVVPGRADGAGAGVAHRDALLKLERAVGDVSLAASAMVVDEAQRWTSGQLRQFADNLQWSGRLSARWSTGAHRLEPTVHVSVFDHLARRGTRDAPPPEATGERQVQRLSELELLYGWTGEDVQVDLGVEAAREELESGSVRGGLRSVASVDPFAQATVELGALTLVPGARMAWSDRWGAHLTPRLAGLIHAAPGVALRLSAGTGYRAPGSKELYMEFLNTGPGFGYVVRGNPDLGPESARNLSAALEWNGGAGYARAQLFHNRYRDFIETRTEPDSAGVAVYGYANVDDGVTRGVELEAGGSLRGVDIEGGWSLLDTEDGATGLPLLGRPRHSGRLAVAAPLPLRARLRLSGTHTGATPLQRDGDAVVEREAWTRVDARLSREVLDGITLAAGVDNVLDSRPAGWPGYTGRQLYLSIQAGRRWGLPVAP